MESLPSSLSIVAEAPGFVRIYEDGTVDRLIDSSTVPPSSQLGDESREGVASKDVVIDPQTGVFVRIFLPRLEAKQKVPVLVYFHGGAFCVESAVSPIYHNYVNEVASEAKVICLSVEYRKVPEHRLPAAYDDGFGVLEWLNHQAEAAEGAPIDPWLASHADFSNVFRGAHRSVARFPRRFVAEKDLLRDRAVLYYEALKKAGKDADLVMAEGEDHVFHLFNPKSENASLMLKRISEFMHPFPSNPTQNLSV